jgi:amino-acid N-acetyltransferase
MDLRLYQPSVSSAERLLARSRLPTADLTPALMQHFLACGPPEDLAGVVGLELYGPVALLRSLAVAASHRSTGLGKTLVAAAEAHAQSCGVQELCVLTTTAERFFERLGYERADRDAAPTVIRGTSEFTSLCPASAAFMRKRLGD